jgi:uncharacterized protein YggE
MPHLASRRKAYTREALDACSRALDEVIAVVRAAGVEPPRLATTELSVHPTGSGKQRASGAPPAIAPPRG